MLTLRHSPSSPFVRKIRIGASVLGLDGEIRIEPADTMNPADSVRQQNPLGKIPALVLEDGTVLFDSRVILEYLDHRAGGGRIIPTDGERTFCRLAPAGAGRRHHGCVGLAGLRGTLAAARAA